MTSRPSPPIRRRRRIVVTIVLLLLVTAVSWWYWPRGDARFVGKWKAGGPEVGLVLTFYANGTGVTVTSADEPTHWAWRVENGKLISSDRHIWIQRRLATIGPWISPFIGYEISPGHESTSEIIEASDSAIRIRGLTPYETMPVTLTRIPE